MFHFLHSLILHSPAVIFGGAIFSKLTNAGVVQPGPNGSTQYYPSASDATAAASQQIPSADQILAVRGGSSFVTAPRTEQQG